MKTRSVILLALAVCVTIIATQNTGAVSFNLLFWDMSMPLILLIVIVFVAGFLIGYLLPGLRRISQRDKKKKSGKPDQ